MRTRLHVTPTVAACDSTALYLAIKPNTICRWDGISYYWCIAAVYSLAARKAQVWAEFGFSTIDLIRMLYSRRKLLLQS